MAESVTFIHAADIHLGAPFKGLRSLSPYWANVLTKSIPDAFRRIIDYALQERVDFVVLAGDIFDNSHPSYADYALFMEGMQQLNEANIQVYCVTGNHDPVRSWPTDFGILPPNTHMFAAQQPSFELYERDGMPLAIIGGRSYYTQVFPANADISQGITRDAACQILGSRAQQAPFMVGVLHTGLNVDPTRSPVNPTSLLAGEVTYWACGHIHQMMQFPQYDTARIAFSGAPQGRAIKETGDHGILKVTLTRDADNSVEFVPLASVVWQQFEVDITDCTTVAQVQEKIQSAQFVYNSTTHCQKMICRVTLTGSTALHTTCTAPVLEDMRTALNDSYAFFYIDTIINRTSPALDVEKLAQSNLFPATFLQVLETARNNTAETEAMLEREFGARGMAALQLNYHALQDLYDEAQMCVLDILGQDASVANNSTTENDAIAHSVIGPNAHPLNHDVRDASKETPPLVEKPSVFDTADFALGGDAQ